MNHLPLNAPTSLLWEITLSCNLRCKHCAAGAGSSRDKELSHDEALSLCDQIAELGIPSVCLMGGEPLVRKDWRNLAARLRQHDIAVGMITNGWLLDDKTIEAMLNLGFCQIGVSLDAADPILHDTIRNRKGAHSKAISAIGRIARLPISHKTVITSVSKSNIAELPGIRDLLLEIGGGFTWIVNISSCHDPTRFDPALLLSQEEYLDLAAFIDEARRDTKGILNLTGTHDMGYFSKRFTDLHDFSWSGCTAGLEMLGIKSNGDVVGCLVLDHSFNEGNLRDKSLKDIWNDPEAFAYNRLFEISMLGKECKGCEFGAICRGGCRDHAVSAGGELFSFPFCLNRMERSWKNS